MSTAIEGIPRQGTPEWHRARAGKITASRFGDLSKNKPGTDWGCTAMSYAYELISERLQLENPEWRPSPELDSAPIRWGNEWEPHARARYQWVKSANIAYYGFVTHSKHPMVGASPDGIWIGEPGLIEIKCPYTGKEHVRTMSTNLIPKQYVAQVQGNLWVTGRQWCDFVSFDPRMPDDHCLYVVRVARDEPYIETLSAKVREFAELVSQLERGVRHAKCAA